MQQLLLFSLVALTALASLAAGVLDADKATEISREIREEFRRTGFNWWSPQQFKVSAAQPSMVQQCCMLELAPSTTCLTFLTPSQMPLDRT